MYHVRWGNTKHTLPLSQTTPRVFFDRLKALAEGCKNLRPYMIEGNVEDFLSRNFSQFATLSPETKENIVEEMKYKLCNLTDEEELIFIHDEDIDTYSERLYGCAVEDIYSVLDHLLVEVRFVPVRPRHASV